MPRLREPRNQQQEEPVKKAAAEDAGPEIEIVEDQPEIEIVETKPEPKPEPVVNEANVALQKQIEALAKSEEINRRLMSERDQALERARERDAQVVKIQKEAYDSQADAISSALAAAGAEADKAQLDIENAISAGDARAQAEAQRRLSMATANLARLEDGKAAIEARAKEPPQQGSPQDQLPQVARDYIALHPEIMSNTRVNNRAEFLHKESIAEGIRTYSPAYFKFMDEGLGYTEKEPEVEVEDEPVTPKKKEGNSIVSAPVSREVAGSNGKRQGGKVTLTRAEVDAAAVAGITVEEYAKQKQKLAEMRASGEYGDQR